VTDLATIRTTLAEALEVVLPGRVGTNPPTTKRWSAPSVFIEQASIVVVEGGWFAMFPVWAVVDGAIEAQIALMDDLVQNCWLAVRPHVDQVGAVPQLVAGFRATVLDCAVELDVETMCAPTPPTAVAVPPVPAATRKIY
jgi:hypothetical protein